VIAPLTPIGAFLAFEDTQMPGFRSKARLVTLQGIVGKAILAVLCWPRLFPPCNSQGPDFGSRCNAGFPVLRARTLGVAPLIWDDRSRFPLARSLMLACPAVP
jgi:hypothetical protein